jgi:hypothetical protein
MDGSATTLVPGAQPIAMAIGGGVVYWSQGDHSINALAQNSVRVVTQADGGVGQLAVTDSALYWSGSEGIYEMRFGWEPTVIVPGAGAWFAIDSGKIYWVSLDSSNTLALFRAPL